MHLPFRKRNAFACGECGVFAISLKRIGKWQSLWRRLAFAKNALAFSFKNKMTYLE